MNSKQGKKSSLEQLVKNTSTNNKDAKAITDAKKKRDQKIIKELSLKSKGPLRDVKL